MTAKPMDTPNTPGLNPPSTFLLAPMPALPDPDKAISLIRARIAYLDELDPWDEWQNEVRIEKEVQSNLGRTIQGKHGWKADLLSRNIRSGDCTTAYILLDILPPLCDWWEEMARDAVMNCPPPENVRCPDPLKTGRTAKIRTITEIYDRWGTVIFEDGDQGNLHLTMQFSFQGEAKISNTIWPFAPPDLIDPMVKSIQTLLGTHSYRDLYGRRRTAKVWPAAIIDGRTNWANQRLYEDWSGTSPEERNVLVKQPSPPLTASGQWNNSSRRVTRHTCDGKPECQYEPPTSSGHTTLFPRTNSGCQKRWTDYSRSLLQSFIQANPDVQFGPIPRCVRQIGNPRHNCHKQEDPGCIKKKLHIDHHQICRFPDGQRFIISQPYTKPEFEPSPLAINEWKTMDPDLTWRTADKSRSWYFPARTNILFLGYKRTLDRLVLDYPMPPDAEAPTGCVEWRSNAPPADQAP